METTARKEGGGYVLNGSKTWITLAPIADMFLIWAKSVDEEGAPVRGFIVEKVYYMNSLGNLVFSIIRVL